MDKRFKPLTPQEQLRLRLELVEDIANHPGRPIPAVVRQVRKALRLTIADYARLCGVSTKGLQDIERGMSSPSLSTVEKLLKPMGLTLTVAVNSHIQKS
jgi:DNA-binding transcriptional regulator YiaG